MVTAQGCEAMAGDLNTTEEEDEEEEEEEEEEEDEEGERGNSLISEQRTWRILGMSNVAPWAPTPPMWNRLP